MDQEYRLPDRIIDQRRREKENEVDVVEHHAQFNKIDMSELTSGAKARYIQSVLTPYRRTRDGLSSR